MAKKTQIMEMNYQDLCKFFNEEQKKSAAKDRQFKRWRNKWSIEKVEGSYKYLVRPLTLGEQSILNVKTSDYMPQLRKIMFEYLKTKQDWVITNEELMKGLYLVNEDFFNNNKFFIQSLVENNNIHIEDLKHCKEEIYKFTSRAIRQVLNEMNDKGVIVKHDMFRVVKTLGCEVEKEFLVERNEQGLIMKTRNKIAKNNYYVTYDVLSSEEKLDVNEKVKEQLGFSKIESVYSIYVDCSTLDFCLQDPKKYLVSKEDGEIMNELSQLKFLRSQQGTLKAIDDITKIKVNNKIVKR